MDNNYGFKRVLSIFKEVSRIPRGSGNEARVAAFVEGFAAGLKLYSAKDAANNVVVRKPGTEGKESENTIILQGHLDMVCEKNNDTVHDFLNDPLDLYIDGDFLCARGTTLGADNGIAVAVMLAIMEDTHISHPPLEFVFTANEEVGLLGAAFLKPEQLTGRYLINLDSEEEGVFCVSCAGGVRANMHIPVSFDTVSGCDCYTVSVRGLKGGHSGMDIDKERANAVKLIGRFLLEGLNINNYGLVSVNGGEKDNAIPREADAVLAISENDMARIDELMTAVSKFDGIFKSEYAASDSGVSLSVRKTGTADEVMTAESAKRVVLAVNLTQNGVFAMSKEIDGLVETSNNLGVLTTNATECEVLLSSAVRSSVLTRKCAVLAHLNAVAETAGAVIKTHGDYPAWEYDPAASLKDKLTSAYRRMYGKEPKLTAIHAGLECGLFAEKIKGIEMISIGPNMYNVHTPNERLSLSSAERFWEFLKEVLNGV